MNIDDLHTFWLASTLKNFNAAAERLGVTQPRVSQRIQALEKALGVELFRRKPFGLTEAGARIVPYAERVLEAKRDLDEVLRLDARPVCLRLGMIESVLHSSLRGLVAALRDLEPQLELEMMVETSLAVQRHMASANLDVAIGALPASGNGIETCACPSLPMVFVGLSARHKAASYRPDQLAELGIVTFQSGSQPHRHATRLMAEHARHTRVHSVSSISGMLELVKAGLGVATLPKTVADAFISPGAPFRILPCTEGLPPLPIHISWRVDPTGPQHALVLKRVVSFMLAGAKQT